jgi:hypothetical protein
VTAAIDAESAEMIRRPGINATMDAAQQDDVPDKVLGRGTKHRGKRRGS